MEQRILLIMALFLVTAYADDPRSVDTFNGYKSVEGSAVMNKEIDLSEHYETVESRGIPSNGKRIVAQCTSRVTAVSFTKRPTVNQCNLLMAFDASRGFLSSTVSTLKLSVPILTNLQKTEQVFDFTKSRKSMKQVLYFFSKTKELRIRRQSCDFIIMDTWAGNKTLVSGNYYQRWMCGD